MFETLKHKEVKIKKPRRCWGCGAGFEIGKFMTYVVCVDDGELLTSYWCEVCQAYIKTDLSAFEDGVAKYEFSGELDFHIFRKKYLCQERLVLTEKINNPCQKMVLSK